MIALDEIRKLAQDCFAKARAAVSPAEKMRHLRMGDDYLKTAEKMERERQVIQAAFPKPTTSGSSAGATERPPQFGGLFHFRFLSR